MWRNAKVAAVPLPSRPLQIASTLVRARVGVRTPLKVTHLTTYRCNVECGFCTRIHLPAVHMGTEQVLPMMDAFARMGTRWWVFNGGEPTLMKDLGKQQGVTIVVATHDPTMARMGDRIMEMVDGTIISGS